MGIFVDKKTRVVVQGITGRDGSFHARQMKEYGTAVVAGVTPGKGSTALEGIPIFNTVAEAVEKTKANTSVIYVPASAAVDAIYEAADAGIQVIVCISEGIPANDMLKVYNYLKIKGVRLIGPNCPGIITPGVTKAGIMPGQIHKKGSVGVVSRSGTLTYEIVYNLTAKKIGQSTCIGIGGDPIIGTNFIDCLKEFQDDPQTEAIVVIGEIGGSDEEEAAAFIKKYVTKPVVGFIAGLTAPADKRMGHAGAIISGGTGTAPEKIKAFEAVGVPVAQTPAEVADLVEKKLAALDKKKAATKVIAKPTPAAKKSVKAKPNTKKVIRKSAPAKKAKATKPAKAKKSKPKAKAAKSAKVGRKKTKARPRKK